MFSAAHCGAEAALARKEIDPSAWRKPWLLLMATLDGFSVISVNELDSKQFSLQETQENDWIGFKLQTRKAKFSNSYAKTVSKHSNVSLETE